MEAAALAQSVRLVVNRTSGERAGVQVDGQKKCTRGIRCDGASRINNKHRERVNQNQYYNLIAAPSPRCLYSITTIAMLAFVSSWCQLAINGAGSFPHHLSLELAGCRQNAAILM